MTSYCKKKQKKNNGIQKKASKIKIKSNQIILIYVLKWPLCIEVAPDYSSSF